MQTKKLFQLITTNLQKMIGGILLNDGAKMEHRSTEWMVDVWEKSL